MRGYRYRLSGSRNSLSHVYRKEAFLRLHDEIMGYQLTFDALLLSIEKNLE